MDDFNMALLCKWKWRIMTYTGSLWHGFLRARYGDINLKIAHGGGKVKGKFNTSQWWRDNLALEGAKPLDFFNSNYSVTDVTVSLMGGWTNEVWGWGDFGIPQSVLCSAEENGLNLGTGLLSQHSSASRSSNDSAGNGGEIAEEVHRMAGALRTDHALSVTALTSPFLAELARLQVLVGNIHLDPSKADVVSWLAEPDGYFSVKRCYALINDSRTPFGPPGEFDKAFGFVCKTEVPMKIKDFGWRSFIDRLSSKASLAKRGIIPNSSTACVFCNMREESWGYLFLNCLYVNLVWKDISEWIGIDDFKAGDAKEIFVKWYTFGKKSKGSEG